MEIKVDVVKGSSEWKMSGAEFCALTGWSCLPQLILSRDYTGSRSTWLNLLLPSRYTKNHVASFADCL